MKPIFIFFVSVLCLSYTFIVYDNKSSNGVPYPEGYQQWTHVKAGTNGRGLHHIFANDKALEGYRTGKFPVGSIIAFEILEKLDDGNGNSKEGKRIYVDVMVKDSEKYDSTGGWGFEEFKNGDKSMPVILNQSTMKCFNCHSQKKDRDFVFSSLRE